MQKKAKKITIEVKGEHADGLLDFGKKILNGAKTLLQKTKLISRVGERLAPKVEEKFGGAASNVFRRGVSLAKDHGYGKKMGKGLKKLNKGLLV